MFQPVIFLALLASCLAGENGILIDKLNPKIVGGSPATIEQFPFQVSLRVIENGGNRHNCGGSIISNQWVLSAAHCTINYNASQLLVRAGSTTEASGGVLKAVSHIIIHAEYNGANDISLLRVASPFVFSNTIQPVALATANTEVPSGTYGIVTGWGATEHADSSPTLLQVSVPIMTNAECRQFYAASLITDGVICAGYKAGGKDSCQGDSGGPLIASGKQVGIVNWGIGCAWPNYPGVYARVAYYRQWITANSGV